MKILGFILEHSESSFSKKFDDYSFNIQNPYKKEILEYLRKGKTVAVSMNIIESLIDGEIIGGSAYQSSGDWIWPSYLAYYLEKIDIEIIDDFTQFVIISNGIVIENTDEAIAFLIDNKVL
jgi:hypothetical protein